MFPGNTELLNTIAPETRKNKARTHGAWVSVKQNRPTEIFKLL